MNNTKKNVIIIPKKRTYKKRKDLEDNSNVNLNMSKNNKNYKIYLLKYILFLKKS